MTTPRDEPRATAALRATAAHAPEIYERWARYVRDARAALGDGAEPDAILARASARWRAEEPAELAFVPDAVHDVVREERHDPAARDFLDRIVRGEAVALRRADGAVVYLPPDLLGAMTPAERAAYEPYDPMLARALRRRALEGELEEAARQRE